MNRSRMKRHRKAIERAAELHEIAAVIVEESTGPGGRYEGMNAQQIFGLLASHGLVRDLTEAKKDGWGDTWF